jgi:hypothetical protein
VTVSLVRADRPCAVYRYAHRTTGFQPPAYIGEAFDPVARGRQHALTSWWWPHVDPQPHVVWYRSKAEARAVETLAILNERPHFNDRHNERNPNRVARPGTPSVSLRRPPARPPQRCGSRRPAGRPVWSRRRQRAQWFAAGWAVVALLLFAAIASYTDVRVEHGAAAAGVAALPIVWWTRRRLRAVRRWWRGLRRR